MVDELNFTRRLEYSKHCAPAIQGCTHQPTKGSLHLTSKIQAQKSLTKPTTSYRKPPACANREEDCFLTTPTNPYHPPLPQVFVVDNDILLLYVYNRSALDQSRSSSYTVHVSKYKGVWLVTTRKPTILSNFVGSTTHCRETWTIFITCKIYKQQPGFQLAHTTTTVATAFEGFNPGYNIVLFLFSNKATDINTHTGERAWNKDIMWEEIVSLWTHDQHRIRGSCTNDY